MSDNDFGAIIESGPCDWQIIQQDARGAGTMNVSGRWAPDLGGLVEVRLVREDTGAPVTAELDWRPAKTVGKRKWSATLANVPAGGLYCLETRYRQKGMLAGEWSTRGDLRHFLGVGDLWVIAGQSNSAGYGRGPVHDGPELGIHMYRNSEQWALASHPMNESTDTRHPANREGANSGHSPYLHFARLIQQETGCPIGLVPTALGGSPLSQWNPTEEGPSTLFENMVHCVRNVGGRVKGVLWYQGESDAGGANALSYAKRFIKSVKAWRKALKSPSLPVITVQLNRFHAGAGNEAGDRDWTILREAQRQVPHKLANVAVVTTFDLPLSDGIHTSPAGNMLLGERMARAALGLAYGRSVDWRAPEIQSARRARGGKEIVLTFADVTSRMDTIDPTVNCFRVEDARGVVPVTRMACRADERINLVLGRKLAGRAVVHGGWGMDPAVVPMDMERFVPMLGFYGVAVE